jgi:hypothetical protein
VLRANELRRNLLIIHFRNVDCIVSYRETFKAVTVTLYETGYNFTHCFIWMFSLFSFCKGGICVNGACEGRDENRAGWVSCKTQNLYAGDSTFEFRPGHRIYLLMIFVVLFSPPSNARIMPEIGHTRFHTNPIKYVVTWWLKAGIVE